MADKVKITIEISQAQERALSWDINDIEEWLKNAIHVKAGQCIKDLILKFTEFNPEALDQERRENIILGLQFQTARERTEENLKALKALKKK